MANPKPDFESALEADYSALARAAIVLCRSRSDVEDVMQETVLRAFNAYHALQIAACDRAVMCRPGSSVWPDTIIPPLSEMPGQNPWRPRAGQRPLIIAHGGGQGLHPANTLPAFEHSATSGRDVLEMDLRLTKDGALVTHHYETIHRRNMVVHYWTVNEPGEIKRLLRLGADGIMTDRPDLLRNVLVGLGY